MILVIIEILVLLVTAGLAVLWIRNPTGNYDPWFIISGIVLAGIEIFRRFRDRKQLESGPPTGTKLKRKSKAEKIIDWIQKHSIEKPLSQVLPHALQLAKLIEDRDLEHWIRMELYGYSEEGGMTENDTVPEYRAITGMHMDRYNQALRIDDPELSYTLPEIEYITFEQQTTILSFIPEKHRPIFQFMIEYGCRPGEARALQWDCIKEGYIVIHRAFSNNILREKTKTGRTRRYPITSYIQEVLDNIPLHISPFLFIRDDSKPYTSKNLNTMWHEACEKAGIKIKLYNGVRHSLGCQLLEMGYDMDLVREQLGHTKVEMTQRYAKRSNKTLGDALETRRKNVVKFKEKVGK